MKPPGRDAQSQFGSERFGHQLRLELDFMRRRRADLAGRDMSRHPLHHFRRELAVHISLQNSFFHALSHLLPPILPYNLINSFLPRATMLPTFPSLTDNVSAISRYVSPCCFKRRQLRIGSLILSSARRACSISALRS